MLLTDQIGWRTKTQIWNLSKVKNQTKTLYELLKITKLENFDKKYRHSRAKHYILHFTSQVAMKTG